MGRTVGIAGITVEELPWVRLLLFLLRHPDPAVRELARQAINYVASGGQRATTNASEPFDQTG